MTDQQIVFNSIASTPLLVIAAFALALLFCWLEWRKPSRLRWLRVAAPVVMVASVLALALRPALYRSLSVGNNILLTPNFNNQQVDSLLKIHPSSNIFRLEETSVYKKASVIEPTPEKLREMTFVLGDGLSPSALDDIETNFIYLPGSPPKGITTAFTENIPVVNKPVSIYGAINNAYNATSIVVESPGGREDSAQLSPSGKAPFELRFIPKQSGQFLYSLRVKNDVGATVETQTFPLDVREEQKFRILVLQNYPTAEIRYLKNFLSGKGFSITMRYQLSKNIYRYEYANTAAKKIDRITTSILNEFDVLIVDTDVLQEIGESERTQLIAAIRNGLGTLVVFNETPGNGEFLQRFSKATFNTMKDDTIHIELADKPVELKTLRRSLRQADNLQPLLRSSSGAIYSGFESHAAGKIGFQLITETYRLMAEGKTESYSALWSPLLGKIARTQHDRFHLRVLSPLPVYPKEPVAVEIISSHEAPSLKSDSTVVPLIEDAMIDNRWTGKTWFDTPGWHTFEIKGDSVLKNIYVHPEGSWSTMRIINQQHAGLIHSSNGKTSATESGYYEPVPVWIFFALFLLSTGFLWLAPKI